MCIRDSIYRRKQCGDKRKLIIGDVVLIKDDTHLPRSLWKTGRVVKLITGKDNNIRGAQLDTVTKGGGIAHRPLAKLIPFEIVDAEPEIVDAEPGTVNAEPESETVNAEPEPETVDPTEPSYPGSSNNCKEEIVHTRSSTRKAAIEGQNLRRLRDRFCK